MTLDAQPIETVELTNFWLWAAGLSMIWMIGSAIYGEITGTACTYNANTHEIWCPGNTGYEYYVDILI